MKVLAISLLLVCVCVSQNSISFNLNNGFNFLNSNNDFSNSLNFRQEEQVKFQFSFEIDYRLTLFDKPAGINLTYRSESLTPSNFDHISKKIPIILNLTNYTIDLYIIRKIDKSFNFTYGISLDFMDRELEV